jgi:hypothetical protein
MRMASLNGVYTRMDDLHQFELRGVDLECLAQLISSSIAGGLPLRVQIGEGYIQFEEGSPNSFTADRSDSGIVVVGADVKYLATLSEGLEQMANDPSDFVHIHLDYYFSEPGVDVSDIVLQRIEVTP